MTLYEEFMEAYKDAHADQNKERRLVAGREMWSMLKSDETKVKLKISELKATATKRKHNNMLFFFKKPTQPSTVDMSSAANGSQAVGESQTTDETRARSPQQSESDDVIELEDATEDVAGTSGASLKRKMPAFKQDLLRSEIAVLGKEIALLAERQLKRLLNEDARDQLESKIKEQAEKEKGLEKLIHNGKRQGVFRKMHPTSSSSAGSSQGECTGW